MPSHVFTIRLGSLLAKPRTALPTTKPPTALSRATVLFHSIQFVSFLKSDAASTTALTSAARSAGRRKATRSGC